MRCESGAHKQGTLNTGERRGVFTVQYSVNSNQPSGNRRWGTLFWLCAVLWSRQAIAMLPVNQPVITSLSVAGTNLDFVATFPAGVAQAVLEMRPTLTEDWQSATVLNVPADGGTIEFAIPMPPLTTAFFRLNATMRAGVNDQGTSQTNAPPIVQYSDELQFVAVPPLGPDSTNRNEAVFHFKGAIDGSDRILINRQGALWEHVNWGWPAGAVTVNDSQWNPSEKNYMTSTGAVEFLPEKYSLKSPWLERITGRDVVALERTNDALVVYMDDTLLGAAPYEFKIHFPLETRRRKPEHPSPAATLKIAAMIDGSDLLKITANEATWTNRAWNAPDVVKLNDLSWNLRETNVWSNTGTNRFLPSGVDFSTAKIVR